MGETMGNEANIGQIGGRVRRTMEIKISVVVTVKNDEAGIARLKESLDHQTIKPDEVIVIRAEEHGNCSRGKGRNIGVRAARNEVIAVTDAGCRPHKDWLNKLYKCYKSYKNHNDDFIKDLPWHSRRRILLVVAGWYRVKAKTDLQTIIGKFLASENPRRGSYKGPTSGGRTLDTGAGRAFLPASRSIMFTKKAWEAAGGYPEEAVSGGEDLEFARRLATHPEVKVIYCPEAVVDWEPPATLGEFFRDIVKHTRGNVEAGYRPHLWRNATVVLRWMVFLVFPWMIPIYLGIKIIKIINVIGGLRSHLATGQGDTLNPGLWLTPRTVLFIPIVQVAADAGVIWGLVTECIKVRPCHGKVGPSQRI